MYQLFTNVGVDDLQNLLRLLHLHHPRVSMKVGSLVRMNVYDTDTTQYHGLILEIGEEDEWGDRLIVVSAPTYPHGVTYWGHFKTGSPDIRAIDSWAVTVVD